MTCWKLVVYQAVVSFQVPCGSSPPGCLHQTFFRPPFRRSLFAADMEDPHRSFFVSSRSIGRCVGKRDPRRRRLLRNRPIRDRLAWLPGVFRHHCLPRRVARCEREIGGPGGPRGVDLVAMLFAVQVTALVCAGVACSNIHPIILTWDLLGTQDDSKMTQMSENLGFLEP